MKPGLYTFIFVSALLHAVIISMHNEWAFSTKKNHEQGSSFLDIELSSETQKSSDSPASKTRKITTDTHTSRNKPVTPYIQQKIEPYKNIKQKNVAATTVKTNITKLQHTTPQYIALKNKIPFSKQKKTNHQNYNRQSINNQNSKKIKTLLNNELAKHFYYPESAQRKKRQGRVVLAFTINKNGLIENIHINKSSGYRVLDTAAINALNKIDANEDLASVLNNHNIEHILPITYKLVGR